MRKSTSTQIARTSTWEITGKEIHNLFTTLVKEKDQTWNVLSHKDEIVGKDCSWRNNQRFTTMQRSSSVEWVGLVLLERVGSLRGKRICAWLRLLMIGGCVFVFFHLLHWTEEKPRVNSNYLLVGFFGITLLRYGGLLLLVLLCDTVQKRFLSEKQNNIQFTWVGWRTISMSAMPAAS